MSLDFGERLTANFTNWANGGWGTAERRILLRRCADYGVTWNDAEGEAGRHVLGCMAAFYGDLIDVVDRIDGGTEQWRLSAMMIVEGANIV